MSFSVPPWEQSNSNDLTSLYRGAMIGQALSKNLGIAQATGEGMEQGVRATMLQAGVAAGKINPATLSPEDKQLFSRAVSTAGLTKVPTVKPQAAGGVLGILGDVGGAIVNTAGDFASALEHVPAGLYQGAQSLYKTVEESPIGAATDPLFGINRQQELQSIKKTPDIGTLASQVAKSTISDFTHFDPMHPLYPVLDVAAVLGGGAGLLARGGGALSRLSAAGDLARAGGDVGRISGTLGRLPGMTRAGEGGAFLARKIGGAVRPDIPISRAAQAAHDLESPSIPIGNYSISPFRRLFVEKPIEAFSQSRLGQYPVPLIKGDKSFSDLRAAYHIRKISNATSGRASALGISRTVEATQGFNKAMHALLHESPNDQVALEKFNALVLLRELAAENLSPEERLQRLEDYRNAVLTTGTPQVEGVPMETQQVEGIRKFYRKQTRTPRFMEYFSNPTKAMWDVRNAWDKALLEGHRSLGLDPNELLQRSLGPAAHALGRTPEEMLREQPLHIQNSMNFARKASEVEQALREALSAGEEPAEAALMPELARYLPASMSLEDRTALVQQAYHSLQADIAGVPERELLNNAEATGYLPGRTLSQKVAQALPAHGVPETVAEPFAFGGLTNYFPLSSAAHTMKLKANYGPIGRATNNLIRKPLSRATRGLIREKDVGVGLHEFKRENVARLVNSRMLGVEPFSSFLQEADLSSFKAGIDRRDPLPFIRHIAQREKLIAHRLLRDPLIEKLALKGVDGTVAQFKDENDLANKLGSIDEARKWRLISPKAIRALVQSEDSAALQVANALREEGRMTPELSAHIDQIADESAMAYVRQLSDETAASGSNMIAVPTSFMDNLIKQARVTESGNRVGHMWQAFINKWRHAVLAYMPSWLLRTSMGHGLLLFISGVWNPAHYFKAMQYFGEGFKVPFTDDTRVFRGLGREVPAGIDQGSPHADFGAIGFRHAVKNPVPTAITHAVHGVANFQRRAAFISNLDRITKQRFAELRQTFAHPGGLRNTENLDAVIRDHPEFVHHALNELDKVSYTFGQMSPWERRLAKNILPFWGWYKFVSKFVWNLPLTYPGRALALARIGQIGQSDMANLGPMPDWLKASVMFDTHNLADVHYMSMMGLNPLGDVINPAGGFQGLIRLGQMSPILQSVLEGAGYNTMTGGLERNDPADGIVEVNGRYVNLATGQEYDNPGQASVGNDVLRFFGSLARSFPEIRLAELGATRGKSVYPESIPFLYERPIPPSTPASVKDASPLGLLAKYAGVQPSQYDLQKYQLNLAKDIRRAMVERRKAVAKEKLLK